MGCEPRLSEVFLAGLPKMLKVHIANEPSGQWIENSIRFSVGEGNESNAGSGLVFAKLSEVLFVETLRRYINSLPPDQIRLARRRTRPHHWPGSRSSAQEPANHWTVSNLARRIGLSRTRFADRFRHFLGESPIAYLAQWRLKLGAELLQSTDNSVAEVAGAVGYGSEASFNRAFKRQFDCAPAQFRRKRKASLVQQSLESRSHG